jgi:hypothetical protein
MGIAKGVMQSFYRKAEGKLERLPWHRLHACDGPF